MVINTPNAINRKKGGKLRRKMAKSDVKEIKWLPDVEEHDYPAAESYLRLLYNDDRVAEIMIRFRNSAIVQFKAKDIFRASRLSLLGVSNLHVEKDRKKILNGKSLSPLLLLRDEPNGIVVIADGYHRLCAIYEFNEDALIPCKII
ncbi:MAG: hypothetical protein PHF31_05070 [Methylobacter sp.]|nr:hypothetical protein [Methylobacter sp.]